MIFTLMFLYYLQIYKTFTHSLHPNDHKIVLISEFITKHSMFFAKLNPNENVTRIQSMHLWQIPGLGNFPLTNMWPLHRFCFTSKMRPLLPRDFKAKLDLTHVTEITEMAGVRYVSTFLSVFANTVVHFFLFSMTAAQILSHLQKWSNFFQETSKQNLNFLISLRFQT